MPSENTVYIAIELSVAYRLVAARLPGTEKPRRPRFEGGDTAALLRLIAELRSQALTRRGGKTDVACCFEAGRDGFWLHRLLTAHGVSTYMLEPTGILMNRRAKRVPKRIGSTQRICFGCVPSGLLAIGRYVVWCVRRRMRKKAPSARTASTNSLYMINSASKTELSRCCSRRASGEGHLCASGSATWRRFEPGTDMLSYHCYGPNSSACADGLSWSWS
jgi:hypothetical protein